MLVNECQFGVSIVNILILIYTVFNPHNGYIMDKKIVPMDWLEIRSRERARLGVKIVNIFLSFNFRQSLMLRLRPIDLPKSKRNILIICKIKTATDHSCADKLYCKTCVKHPLKNRQNKGLNDKWLSLIKVESIAECSLLSIL